MSPPTHLLSSLFLFIGGYETSAKCKVAQSLGDHLPRLIANSTIMVGGWQMNRQTYQLPETLPPYFFLRFLLV